MKESAGTTTFTYDDDGNQTLKWEPGGNRTTNTWDFENRLTKVELPGNTVNTLVYNGGGQRVEKVKASSLA